MFISAGARKVYFIDVPRPSNNEDSISNLVTVVENLKNGFLVSNFYGKYASLIMDPPYVLIFSNKPCLKTELNKDRWRRFYINKKYELKEKGK